jgi:hypothetical protein
MDSVCEILINVVMLNKPKVLTGLPQNGNGAGTGGEFSPVVNRKAPGGKGWTYPTLALGRNMVSPYLSRKGKRPAREADGGVGTGTWKKRTLLCNGGDRG